MNKIFITLLISFNFCLNAFSQTIYSDKQDVFASKGFTFYGFDYTQLGLVDGSRMGQDFTKFFPALSELLLRQFNQKKLEISYRKGKNNIPFYTLPVEEENRKINNGKVVVDEPKLFSPELIASMVSKYKLNEKEGIGCVVLFECFNRATEMTTVRLVFFDIASRGVLHTTRCESRDRNQYNWMADWKKASTQAMEKLFSISAKEFNIYRKEQKKAAAAKE